MSTTALSRAIEIISRYHRLGPVGDTRVEVLNSFLEKLGKSTHAGCSWYLNEEGVRPLFAEAREWIDALLLVVKTYHNIPYVDANYKQDCHCIGLNLQEQLYHNYFAALEVAELRGNERMTFQVTLDAARDHINIRACFTYMSASDNDYKTNRCLAPILIINSVRD